MQKSNFETFRACLPLCSTTFDPVCDSEGTTHNNLCQFNYESCRRRNDTGMGLVLVSFGPCPGASANPPPPFSAFSPPQIQPQSPLAPARAQSTSPVPVSAPKPQCNPLCTDPPNAVCDENGKTHASLCLYRYESCLHEKSGNEPLILIHFGECVEQLDYTQINVCQPVCTADVDPVCSTSGRTFSNMCYFNLENCKLKNSSSTERIRIASRGACNGQQVESIDGQPIIVKQEPQARLIPSIPSIPSHSIDGQTSNQISKTPRTSLIPTTTLSSVTQENMECNGICTPEEFPVCDNQNKTHPNFCVFNYHSCVSMQMTGKDLAITHLGPCDSFSIIYDPLGEICDSSCDGEPPFPLCAGNDNKTFPNFCVYKAADCRKRTATGRGIELKTIGPCQQEQTFIGNARPEVGHLIQVNDAQSIDATSSRINSADKYAECNPKCPRNYDPVCDNEGKTHSNRCLFDYANCMKMKMTGKGIEVRRSVLFLISVFFNFGFNFSFFISGFISGFNSGINFSFIPGSKVH